MEEAVTRTERWEPDYRELVEKAGDAIYTLDLEGKFTYGNEAGLNYLGYGQADYDEFLGKHFLDLLTPDSKKVALEHFRRGLVGETISPFFEVQAYHRDGRILDFEIRASDLYRDGEMIGRQGFVRNISDMKQLQAKVTETSKRLALMEERERIAAALYNRVAELATSSTSPDEMRAIEAALTSVTAERSGLNPDDLEILGLLAKGRTNREIAEEVHLSPHTVKDRVGRILKALGATGRAEAVATAIHKGLVSKPEAH